MRQNIYRIRKSFIIPLAIDTVLLSVLFILSCLVRGSLMERGVLALFVLAAFFVLIEATRRTIVISDEGLRINKFFRLKTLAWTEITHIGCLTLRRRVYILLTTTKGFYVMSNAYDRFSPMVRDLVEHVPGETIEVEDEARAQIENPVRNVSDLIAAWVAAAVLSCIIYFKLTS